MKKNLVLSLGSNLGNRYAYIQQAILAINDAFDTVGAVAQYYETPPWGDTNQSRFINTAALLETDYNPLECINFLQNIETTLGRTKTHKWGPRAIDIDIVFYGNEQINNENLIVPHPHMHTRAFVLAPLCDIIPSYIHPILDQSMEAILTTIENDTKIFTV